MRRTQNANACVPQTNHIWWGWWWWHTTETMRLCGGSGAGRVHYWEHKRSRALAQSHTIVMLISNMFACINYSSSSSGRTAALYVTCTRHAFAFTSTPPPPHFPFRFLHRRRSIHLQQPSSYCAQFNNCFRTGRQIEYSAHDDDDDDDQTRACVWKCRLGENAYSKMLSVLV